MKEVLDAPLVSEGDETAQAIDPETGKIDSRFDYIINPVVPSTDVGAWARFCRHWGVHESALGGKIWRGNRHWVPKRVEGYPLVVEVMTASTSGSNSNRQIGITYAFRSAWDQLVLHSPVGTPMLKPDAPGMNRRQTWARMGSQLITKSEFAKGWGGRTVWLMQDTLLRYIEEETKINSSVPVPDQSLWPLELNEVNLISMKYQPVPDPNANERPIQPGSPRALVFDRMIADTIPSALTDGRRNIHGIMHASFTPRPDKLAMLMVKNGALIIQS